MTRLTDEQLYAAYYSRIENDDQDPILGLRAVADAAIAADRAARAEPVAWALIEPSGHVTAVRIEREQLEETYMVAGDDLTPLYTAPPAAPVVSEDTAREIIDAAMLATPTPLANRTRASTAAAAQRPKTAETQL